MTNILLIALALLGVLLALLAGWEVELRRQRDQSRLMAERMEDRAVAAEIENAALRQVRVR